MNPFKQKRLEEFTIVDCEEYIRSYPYGEHVHEVKAFLRKLKKAHGELLSTVIELGEHKKVGQRQKEETKMSMQVEGNKRVVERQVSEGNIGSTESSSVVEDGMKETFVWGVHRILSWLWDLGIVAVVGTVIIFILRELFAFDWLDDYWYVVYILVFVGLGVIQK